MKVARLLAASLALGLSVSGCAADPMADQIAGLYSTRHKVSVEGRQVEIYGFMNIDRGGRMTVYGLQDSAGSPDGKECYFLVSGNAFNAALQGQTLTEGQSPTGEPDYEVLVGDDTFGILTDPDKATGKMRWFIHSAKRNNTITITGEENKVNTDTHSFSISPPRLISPALADILGQQCAPGSLR